MDIDIELKILLRRKNEKRTPVTMTVHPSILDIIDKAREETGASRGDFLAACALRVISSYDASSDENAVVDV